MTTKVYLKTRDGATHTVKNGMITFNGVTASFISEEAKGATEVSIGNVDYVNAELVPGDPEE